MAKRLGHLRRSKRSKPVMKMRNFQDMVSAMTAGRKWFEAFKNKTNTSMSKNTRQQRILDAAIEFCQNHNNKVSTKELKIELRNKYPQELWNQYNGGTGVEGVSDIFHRLVSNGYFVSVADNGTYQTYAYTKFPLPKDRKGAAFVPDMEEGITSLGQVQGSSVAGLGSALGKASKKSQQKAAQAVGGTVLGGAPRKKTMPSKRATTTARTAVVPKAPASTPSVAKTVTKSIPATKISRIAALDLMKNSKGRFFTATFIKKDGTERTINAKYLADQEQSELGYVKVVDQKKFKVDPKDSTRNINLQTLISLKVGGTLYKIK